MAAQLCAHLLPPARAETPEAHAPPALLFTHKNLRDLRDLLE